MSCCRQKGLCVLFTAHVCKPRHGHGAAVFSATNQLDTSSERGVGNTEWLARTTSFSCLPLTKDECGWRMGGQCGFIRACKAWTKGEATNQAPTKRELYRQQQNSGSVHNDLHMVRL